MLLLQTLKSLIEKKWIWLQTTVRHTTAVSMSSSTLQRTYVLVLNDDGKNYRSKLPKIHLGVAGAIVSMYVDFPIEIMGRVVHKIHLVTMRFDLTEPTSVDEILDRLKAYYG